MAVPTISSINPTSGLTGGRNLVTVVGTNFRIPPDPPAAGPTNGQVPQTVRITIGGKLATQIEVWSATKLTFLSPIHDAGAVNVVLQNLDNLAAPISGEVVTATNGFTYVMPNLSTQSDFNRVVGTLLLEMRRQIMSEVVTTVHTDWSVAPNSLGITAIAKLPALVLVGPNMNENRLFSQNHGDEVDAGGGITLFRRNPYTVDLLFNFTGISAKESELLNLMALVTQFFHRNKYLVMDRDPSDLSKGTVKYEMDFPPDGEPKVIGSANNSNIRSFSGKFVVYGFDLEDVAGIINDEVVDETYQVTNPITQTDNVT